MYGVEPHQRARTAGDSFAVLADLGGQLGDDALLLRARRCDRAAQRVVVVDQRVRLDEQRLTAAARVVDDPGQGAWRTARRERARPHRHDDAPLAFGHVCVAEGIGECGPTQQSLGRLTQRRASPPHAITQRRERRARRIGQTDLAVGTVAIDRPVQLRRERGGRIERREQCRELGDLGARRDGGLP
mgnify:CR=1 FL=1